MSKLIVGAVVALVVVAVIVAISISRDKESENIEYITYNKHGFSFEYPAYMELEETDKLLLSSDEPKEVFLVHWFDEEPVPPKETLLAIWWLAIESNPGYSDLTKENIVNTTINGHEMIYQPFTVRISGDRTHGVVGAWFCGQRAYLLSILVPQNALSKFQQYLNSFVCH